MRKSIFDIMTEAKDADSNGSGGLWEREDNGTIDEVTMEDTKEFNSRGWYKSNLDKSKHTNIMERLRTYLTEKIMNFDKKIELEFTIRQSGHSMERQYRHGSDDMNYISDEEILEEVRKASGKIIEDIIANHLNMEDRFIVRDGNTDLNIVCQLHPGRNGKDNIQVDIVTVIRAEKFWNTKNNWVVMI